jgi:type IV pilus assembly protein PilO
MVKIDFRKLGEQFSGLQLENVGTWPLLPRLALWALLIATCLVLGWFLAWSNQSDELDRLSAEEDALKAQYRRKLQLAVNLDELRRQKEQVGQFVLSLEKQLPNKAEIDALLTDINKAGIGRGLQFELFRPGSLILRDYYAELPIAIRISGRYRDLGGFTSDIANLSRIVTLDNLVLQAVKDGGPLALEATAKTYRYLDEEELLKIRRARSEKNKK